MEWIEKRMESYEMETCVEVKGHKNGMLSGGEINVLGSCLCTFSLLVFGGWGETIFISPRWITLRQICRLMGIIQ